MWIIFFSWTIALVFLDLRSCITDYCIPVYQLWNDLYCIKRFRNKGSGSDDAFKSLKQEVTSLWAEVTLQEWAGERVTGSSEARIDWRSCYRRPLKTRMRTSPRESRSCSRWDTDSPDPSGHTPRACSRAASGTWRDVMSSGRAGSV